MAWNQRKHESAERICTRCVCSSTFICSLSCRCKFRSIESPAPPTSFSGRQCAAPCSDLQARQTVKKRQPNYSLLMKTKTKRSPNTHRCPEPASLEAFHLDTERRFRLPAATFISEAWRISVLRNHWIGRLRHPSRANLGDPYR